MTEDDDTIRPAAEQQTDEGRKGPEVPEPEEWRPFGFEW